MSTSQGDPLFIVDSSTRPSPKEASAQPFRRTRYKITVKPPFLYRGRLIGDIPNPPPCGAHFTRRASSMAERPPASGSGPPRPPPPGGGGGAVPPTAAVVAVAPQPESMISAAMPVPVAAAAAVPAVPGGTVVVMPPSEAATRLFGDVRKGLEKSATVIWKNAVDSLTAAHTFYLYTPAPDSPEMAAIDADGLLTPRSFVEQFMAQITNILLDQNPKTTGNFERGCVEESLRIAVAICQVDLRERVAYWERVGYGGLNEARPKPKPKPKPREEEKDAKDGSGGDGDDDDDDKTKKKEDGGNSDNKDVEQKKEAEGGGNGGGGDDRDASGTAGGEGGSGTASAEQPQAPEDAAASSGPVGPWQSYPSPLLSILAAIFDRRKIYYRGPQQRWNSHGGGLPAVRLQNIRKFLDLGGLPVLCRYLEICAGMNGGAPPGPDGRVGTVPSPWTFPETVQEITSLLSAVGEAVPDWIPLKGEPKKQGQQQPQPQPEQRATTPEGFVLPTAAEALTIRSAIAITRPVLHHLSFAVTDKWLKSQDHDSLKEMRRHMTRLMDAIGPSRTMPPPITAAVSGGGGPGYVTTRGDYIQFYSDLNRLIHRYLTCSSLLLRLLGWDELDSILGYATKMTLPPKRYVATNAGCPYINGSYEFGAETDADGWALVAGGGGSNNVWSTGELKYLHTVPADDLRKKSSSSSSGGDETMAAADGAAPEAAPAPAPAVADAAAQQGKVITLFRCTMRSNQKWWFLSEADPDQPGTDKDIDYYQHKSKTQEEMNIPPSDGWVTCGNRNSDGPGKDPPPTLRPRGELLPPGQEAMTLAAQISAWAVKNKVIELVLGGAEGGGTHREVVSRSTELIEFMAELGRKWEEDELEAKSDEVAAAAPVDGAQGISSVDANGAANMDVDRFSPATIPGGVEAEGSDASIRESATLQPSHLSLAWETYTSSPDDAVTEEVCKMLVSILPKLSDKLAIHLLELVGGSLDRKEKAKNLPEVVAFCSSMVMKYPVVHTDDQKSRSKRRALSDAVRSQVLLLLWSVLNHPEASSSSTQLRPQIENLKEYVRNELRYHPKSRMNFLEGCRQELERNAVSAAAIDVPFNEKVPLRTVNLTRFVLEACPADEAEEAVAGGREALTALLFRELAAYLKRYKQISTKVGEGNRSKNDIVRKSSSISTSGVSVYSHKPSPPALSAEHASALTDRLNFLRNAYSLSNRVGMSTDELQQLWRLCGEGSDREALMVFLAGRESGRPTSGGDSAKNDANNKAKLGPAFSDEVRQYGFQNLFCSASLDWSHLGISAYTSFQLLLQSLGDNADESKALDALWKICLTAGTEDVAAKAMADLFALYESNKKPARGPGRSSFSDRVFEALVQVKDGLDAGQESSEREAERCLRILSAALKRRASEPTPAAESEPQSQPLPQPQPQPQQPPEPPMTLSPVSSAFLSSIKTAQTCTEVMAAAPHGLRGKSSKIPVGVVAKRLQPSEGKGDERFALEIHPLETLADVRAKVARHCNYDFDRVRAISITGGSSSGAGAGQAGKSPTLTKFPSKTLVADLAVRPGCEIVFMLTKTDMPAVQDADNTVASGGKGLLFDDDATFDGLFDTLFGVLEALPTVPKLQALSTSSVNSVSEGRSGIAQASRDTHQLVWDILDFLPTNLNIANDVLRAAKGESRGGLPPWSALLDRSRSSHKSIYIMEVIDSFLRPAVEILSVIPKPDEAAAQMMEEAAAFRRGFIETGGFVSIMNLFTKASGEGGMSGGGRRLRPESEKGNTVALRVLKCCFMGSGGTSSNVDGGDNLDDIGVELMKGMQDCRPLLESLSGTVVLGQGMSDKAILDTIQLLRLLLRSDPEVSEQFVMLPNEIAKQFIITLLLWDRGMAAVTACAAADTASRIRRWTEDLLLTIPSLSRRALPWLMEALERIDCKSEATEEFFSAMQILVQGEQKVNAGSDGDGDGPVDPVAHRPDLSHLRELSSAVCRKIASHPKRQQVDSAGVDASTEVLGGCFSLLRALVESGGGAAVADGVQLLLDAFGSSRWSQAMRAHEGRISRRNEALIDLMGAVFEGYLSPLNSSTVPASSIEDDKSRRLGFEVVTAAARASDNGDGYMVLVDRIDGIISTAAPSLRYRWGHNVSSDDKTSHRGGSSGPSKFTGLKNQGCTCYMNSLLQQLFMMPGLRERLCSATLPAPLRSVGSGTVTKGPELVGKKINVHWENNSSYEATVEGFNEVTGMHTIRYARLPVQFGGRANITQEELSRLPEEMLEEFFLYQGRPGKETGSFEIVEDKTTMETEAGAAGESSGEGEKTKKSTPSASTDGILVKSGIQESEDEMHSRKLFEEVQRTFVHLSEGLRGRCYDPCPLVEASACLKMEFEVWQQNDASEYAVKLLDKLEVPLKRWSPGHFKYLENTFGLKQTKQKVCKECGLKTNREEHFMNIDCQIRGKSDIHEALATMCEVEVMEGDNKVNCERCKKNTDTVLQTAISRLPNMLVLSLKRFDLDYNTFETVKINSRCSFDQTLNMKRYTLEAAEKLEQAEKGTAGGDGDGGVDESDGAAMAVEGVQESSTIDTDTAAKADGDAEDDPLSSLPDEDYEYKLAGVLIHAGVAQGGHYYSFIRDRTGAGDTNADNGGGGSSSGDDKWYRFDDEDVTPFDPALIEQECFGGKVKKEQKFGNGQVHTVEQEQFANALMLFYEKVKPSDPPMDDKTDTGTSTAVKEGEAPMDVETEETVEDVALKDVVRTSGFDAFQPDVQRSNKTQCWLDFLMSSDFQHLLSGLIDSCLLFSRSGGSEGASDIGSDTMDLSADEDGESYSRWHIALLRTVLSYVFDILLHSPERSQLKSWEKKMVHVLRGNTDGARLFVHELAQRTNSVSSNWLRTYCLDCPEKDSREVAAKVFHAGIQACAKISQEKEALQNWSEAWQRIRQKYDEEIRAGERRVYLPMPASLKGTRAEQLRPLEDVTKLEHGASSIGTIISFINQLLEMVPLAWKHSGGMYCLLRDMACVPGERGRLFRRALMEAQVSNRLALLATRGESHQLAAHVFPACSMRYELANVLIKPETAPTTHMMMGTTHRTANQQHPTQDDFCNLFGAIGCIVGNSCMKMDPVLVERTLPGKTTSSLELTEEARNALATVYTDWARGLNGLMSFRSFRIVLGWCQDIDETTLNNESADLFKKSGIDCGTDRDGRTIFGLPLDAFLMYFRDRARRAGTTRILMDLHSHGFRPNLTRRSDESRFRPQDQQRAGSNDDEAEYENVESTGLDVMEIIQSHPEDFRGGNMLLGKLAAFSLQNYSLFCIAHHRTYQGMAEYFLDFVAVGHKVVNVLWDALTVYYSREPTWNHRDADVDAAKKVFDLMASLRDNRISERVDCIMGGIGGGGGGDTALGLIRGAAEFSRSRNREFARRYLDTVKNLIEEHSSVKIWCQGHPREFGPIQHILYPQHVRHHQRGYDHRDPNAHSDDSDMYTDDDEDARMMDDPDDEFATITGAGLPDVNGLYQRTVEICDGLPVYKMQGSWRGRPCSYCLFRCRLSNGKKSWFISYVPQGVKPGTTKDVDFYSADPVGHFEFPPDSGWTRCAEGVDPPPNLRRHGRDMADEELFGDAPMDEDDNVHESNI